MCQGHKGRTQCVSPRGSKHVQVDRPPQQRKAGDLGTVQVGHASSSERSLRPITRRHSSLTVAVKVSGCTEDGEAPGWCAGMSTRSAAGRG